ncbi:hypothetical protein CHLNCDRAFT_141080 [Chlorella variabilis]|uniref:PPM-type phosphatase domain-containing protein n=1 Tax=Chlorella variabilis TaxID=554065 RepID=E1ZS43_CHLVA|nr:hypothetical protein CHLNCDRAFT_141080 [Chlorella variabilis]EFN51321.1 hypothetical protein CHLNCDRAFT_141080 [Chlorella variabilis]|eukprot:XP_005843423.1 hypothetical protein CHLNCDRAFT_141080 [Chlorella variabilis]
MRLARAVSRNLSTLSSACRTRPAPLPRLTYHLRPPPPRLGPMESEKLGAAAGLATRAERLGHQGEAAGREAPGEGPVGDKRAQVGDVSPGRLHPQPPASDMPRANLKAAGAARPDTNHSDGPSLAVHIGVSDEQGQRSYMEDRHTVIPDFRPKGAADPALPRQFVAVYDGHSSHHGSEHASRRVHQFVAAQPAIQQCSGAACDQEAVQAALKAAFEAADTEIVETAVQDGKRYGTTAVCALRMGQTVYVAHAGDSRAVLCRDGRAVTLTRDHKPASVPQERERIEAQGGHIAYDADRVLSNPEGQRRSRLAMSRCCLALGDPDFKTPRRLVEAEPDVARVELRPHADSFMLLGSDGLFDVMSGQEAVDAASRVLASSKANLSSAVAEAAADALVRKAMQDGTSDNVTALIMAFDWD